MSLRLTMPTGMSLQDWSDQMVFELDQYGSFGRMKSDADWKDWAANILNTVTLSANLPNPYDFTDWKDWAERFCQAAR